MQARRKIAVAGATGNVGRHVVDVLKNGGHDVVGISRSSGVDVVSGGGLAEALETDLPEGGWERPRTMHFKTWRQRHEEMVRETQQNRLAERGHVG